MDMMFKNKFKGFTLIELIVVISILGILVLMAMPWFHNNIAKARLTQIKNDTKISENVAKEKLLDNGKYPDNWESVDRDELKELAKEKKLYDIRGLVVDEDDVEEGDYVRHAKKSFNTRLKGSFYVNQGGKGYYEDTKAGSIMPGDDNDGDNNGGPEEGGPSEPGDGDGSGGDGTEGPGDGDGSGGDGGDGGGPGDGDNGGSEKEEVDKSELEDIIEEAEGLPKDDYEEGGWGKLEDAVDKGKDVLEDEDAIQKEVDDAVKEIEDAIEELMPIKPESNFLRLDEIPLGSIVYDAKWSWRHRNGANGQPSAVVDKAFVPMEWITVARNHYTSPIPNVDHVTLMSDYIIANYNYNTIASGSRNNQQTKKYENSIVNTYLNNNFWNVLVGWVGTQDFLNQSVSVNMPYINIYGKEADGAGVPSAVTGNMRANVFIPSYRELNNTGLGINVGKPWEWFTNPESKPHLTAKARDVNGNIVSGTYWTRTHPGPEYNLSQDPTGTRFFITSILQYGNASWGYGDRTTTGIRPVVNLKADTMVELQEDGRYKITYQ